jgi:CheY-like chemotaxis protein
MCQFTALVVEDDTLQREAIADLLRDRGLEVIECTTARPPNSWKPCWTSHQSSNNLVGVVFTILLVVCTGLTRFIG